MQPKAQLIKEMIEDALLAESRAKDLKKKYPALAEFGVIDELSKIDPSGNNKYLGWMLKHWIAVMQEQFGDKGFAAFMTADADQELPPEEETKLVNLEREITVSTQRVLSALEPILKTYHKNLDLVKSLQKSGRINLDGPANDINTFQPGSLELLEFVRELKAERQRREREKEQAKAVSKQAKSESSIVYEDEHVRVIRPKTKLAACYFGKGTKWCISAEMSRNYFNSYTSKGRAFYFMFWSGAPNPEHPYAKVAMVVDASDPYGDPQVEEYFDSPDDAQSASEVATGVRQMWRESGYDGKVEKEYVLNPSDSDHVLVVIEEVIQDAEDSAKEEAAENRPGPSLEQYEEIMEKYRHREWKYIDIYIDQEYTDILATVSMTVDLNAILKRYMKEKNVFLQWAPGFPEKYNQDWIEENLEKWILDWYQVNSQAELYDSYVEEDTDQRWDDKDNLVVSLKLELSRENLQSPEAFEELMSDFEKDDAALDEFFHELLEDEEYFDIYKRNDSRENNERVLIVDKYSEEYFPGGPEFAKDQLGLPFNAGNRRPGDVIDQMTKKNQRFFPIDLPDDLREELERKVLQKLESRLVAEAFMSALPEVSKEELLKLAQEAGSDPSSQARLVELISRLLGDYFELENLD